MAFQACRTGEQFREDALQEALDVHVLNRIGTPIEIGLVAVFLLSDEGSWITGESIAVDGGVTIG